MSKVFLTPQAALAGLLTDGMTIMAGGFGLCGVPFGLIDAIAESGAHDLTVIANNAGIDGIGLGRLLETRQIKKMIASYVGENELFARLCLNGDLQVEFNPQGTLSERIRAGGAGIPAFFTRTGVGTDVGIGKEVRQFDGRSFLLERALRADLALVHAYRGDSGGNLIYRMTARNFNPIMATAADITVAEVEELVLPGEIDADHIITPGIYVNRIVEVVKGMKPIEKRTTRTRNASERIV
jgi:3-oxoacid CoA-transferase subunit A